MNTVEHWMCGCDTREKLQSIINFLDTKISQYDYILSNYNIAFWYTNSIYNEIKEYLFSHIKQLEELHNSILEEIVEIERQIELEQKRIRVVGFERIFLEDEQEFLEEEN